MKRKKFSEFIFVRIEAAGDETYLLAFDKAGDAIEGSGPTRVATYKLVDEDKLSTRVVGTRQRRF